MTKRQLTIEAVCAFMQEIFPPEYRHLVWLAGGSVRDSLLARESRDIDLVAAVPAGLLASLGFNLVKGISTTPVWFRNFPEYGNVEITLLEGGDALPADLKRRDFTLNAMLMTLDGLIIDPLEGRLALESLELRTCSELTFVNDPLRIFRAFRFAAEGFVFAAETEVLIKSREWNEELKRIPVERFSREMLKALESTYPERFFLGMIDYGVGAEFLPEVFKMPTIPAGPVEHHPEGDLLTHSIQVLERVSARSGSPLARFCAFFHDIGKLATDPALYPKHHGHDEAGFSVAEDFCQRLALPSSYGRALAWTSRLHGNANRLAELRPSTRLRMAEQATRGGIAELLPLISAADKPGNDIAASWRGVVAIAELNMADLGIDTEKLTFMKPEKRADFILQRRIDLLKNKTC